MTAYNEIQAYLDEKDFAEKQEILKQRNDRPTTERVSLVSAKKKDNFFISGLKTTGRTIKGGALGGFDVLVDTATGAYQMVRHPIQTYQSMEHMVLHPVETGKYMGNAIAESFTRDMINGDAESRSHWVTYALGTVLGTKGAGNAVKSTRVGSDVTKAAKESLKNATNKAGNIQMPNLFPYGPQHQLATVGPVPYNIVDGVNLRDQMMMSAKRFSSSGNFNSNIRFVEGKKQYNVKGKWLTAKQFSVLRQKAVRHAWKAEKELVEKTGKGTRNWTESELVELLSTGKVKGYEGQHMKSANEFPDFAGDPDNIQFLKGRTMDINEHLDAHKGNYQNPTNGYYDHKTGNTVDFGDKIPWKSN